MADPVEAHSLHEVWSSGELLGPDAANERDLALQRGVLAASEVMARLFAGLEPGDGELGSYSTMAVMVLRVDGNQALQRQLLHGLGAVYLGVLRAAAVDAFGGGEDLFRALGGAPGATIDAGRVAGALDALMAYLEESANVDALREATKGVKLTPGTPYPTCSPS